VSTAHLEVALAVGAELGEGPIWEAGRQQLLFVDIMRGDVHAFDPATGSDAVIDIGQPAGAVAPTTRADWIVAAADGFYRANPLSGEVRLVAIVEGDIPDNRMNDGYCDPQGRFWAGTMSMTRRPKAGALYRLNPEGGVTRMLDGVTTSNGIDWSLDGRTMYYVDTETLRVDAFDFDGDRGEISNRRPLVVIPASAGKPDGLIVDAEGGLWLALWGGAAVRRYTPDGRLDRTIDLPVPHPTKCAFGGRDLSDLYITSASIALSPEQRAATPLAGHLFRCRPGVKGRLPTPFAG
jgi:sugar lactone lactonase YvrE